MVIDTVTDPLALTRNILKSTPRTEEKGYTHLRCSEIDGVCPRELVIGHRKALKRKVFVSHASICVMDMGSALHWWLQNRPVHFGDSLVGYWKCVACGNKRRFGRKPDNHCEFCGAAPAATFYDEYQFRLDSPYCIVGRADLILNVGGVYRFGEIKTIADSDTTLPVGKDVAQLGSYLYFSQFDKPDALPVPIDRSVGYLIYFSKKFNYKAPVKTYAVRPTETLMAPLIEKARAFTAGSWTEPCLSLHARA